MPNFFFTGTWHHYPESFGGDLYSAERIEVKPVDKEKPVISIDGSQFIVEDFRYNSSQGKTIHYNLTIQRSTGRFTEAFLEEDGKFPFLERSGRFLAQSK